MVDVVVLSLSAASGVHVTDAAPGLVATLSAQTFSKPQTRKVISTMIETYPNVETLR